MTKTKSDAEKARDVALAWKKYSLSDRGIRAAVRIAQSDPKMRVSINQLDANPYDLNTPDGTVDLVTGVMRKHNPSDYCTKITGAGYARGADCPKWKAFLNTTFEGNQELIAYMQKLLGYAATGKVTHNLLPFLYGATGDNGKTVFLNVVLKVLGDYAIVAPGNFLLAGKQEHATEIARLMGIDQCVVDGLGPV